MSVAPASIAAASSGSRLPGPAKLIAAAGLHHPQELRPHHLVRRISPNQVRLASALLPFLEPGQLLDPDQLPKLPPVFALYWPKAQAESFKSLD